MARYLPGNGSDVQGASSTGSNKFHTAQRTGRLLLLCFAVFAMGFANAPADAQANEWTWMSGSSSTTPNGGLPGVYGTLGVPAAQNMPGGRFQGASWTDSSGNLWLFGGKGFDSTGTGGYLNDLWEYDPSTREWTWMGGNSSVPQNCHFGVGNCGQPGVYGTLGTPAATNNPGGRAQGSTWTDASGNFWLFGGYGYDSVGTPGNLNDLWEFSPATKEWVWMGGISSLNYSQPGFGTAGIYGTLGTPSAGNVPGGRTGAVSWVDKGGNLWLFGGAGNDSTGGPGFLNDLWEFNPSIKEWAWMGGASTLVIPVPNCSGGGNCEYYAPGVYGTLGVAATGNVPSGRTGSVAWVDASGNVWLFGGNSYSSVATAGSELNDLWELNSSTNEWAWMGGSDTVVCSSNTSGYTFCGQPGVHGALFTPAPTNIPGGRSGAVSWTTGDGSLWLFGGWGFDSTTSNWGWLDDVWEFKPSINQWAWMSGSNTASGNAETGVYGTLGVAAASNIPGGRELANSWIDRTGNLWLFGGWGIDSTGNYGDLNDLWVWQGQQQVATPNFSVATGTYTSVQTVMISDTTPGAIIYYTTDGTVPTASSTMYSGAVPVGASETIQAIAIAAGYNNSAVASATYTVNLPPPTFTLGISAPSLTMKSSQQGTITVTVTPQNGFGSAVAFACSGLAAGASCAFSPKTVTPAGAAVTTTLTISAQTLSANVRRNSFPYFPATGLALAVCLFGLRRRSVRGSVLLLAAAVIGVTVVSGCGGGGGSSTTPTPTPMPVTSTVTVTATSGSIQQATTLSLTVD
jgi:N-acetylneuraminic acid mutarotase